MHSGEFFARDFAGRCANALAENYSSDFLPGLFANQLGGPHGFVSSAINLSVNVFDEN
jgi:hypothetical protein